MTIRIEARDTALRRLGEVADYSTLKAPLRFCRPSTWTLVSRSRDTAALLSEADGIIVTRDDEVLFSGPIATRQDVKAAGARTLTVTGFDDDVWLDFRLALPVPGGPPYALDYDDKSGPAETVMRWYVDRNLGPSATPARRLPRLVLEPDLGRGAEVRGRARFHTLAELLQPLALAGGDLGYRIVQVGETLAFQVRVPQDLTGTAVFSEELGNLAGYDFRSGRAATNYVYAGGGGEGAARLIVEGGDAVSLEADGRREAFLDRRDTEDVATLEQARDERLAEAVAPTALSLSPVDTDGVTFGVDYRLGDRVTVVVDEQRIQDVVREVLLDVTPERDAVFTPVVGTPGARDPRVPQLFTMIARQARRVSNLERR